VNLRARKEHEAKTGGRKVRSLPKALLSQSSRTLLEVYTKHTELPSYLFRDWWERSMLTSSSGSWSYWHVIRTSLNSVNMKAPTLRKVTPNTTF